MKILKFGGKSLANGRGLETVLEIVEQKIKKGEHIALVVSARGNATDDLLAILEKATSGESYLPIFEDFKTYQKAYDLDFPEEFALLEKLFEGVSLLGDYSDKIKDQIVAQGEIISAKLVTYLLEKRGINAVFVDSRKLLVSDDHFGNAQVKEAISQQKTQTFFDQLPKGAVAVVTGFIAATEKGETTTLGRNGSNYSAALFANFLQAEELQNFTHVNGIYTANPDWVSEAQIIRHLSYQEANELANFGATILHAKTIIPLISKGIPLRILNTFNADDAGTLIHSQTAEKGIRSLSVLEGNALIILEGRGLLGQVGVDARIFRALAQRNISVSIISQGSSERGIGFLVANQDAEKAKKALEEEFESDFYTKDVSEVSVVKNVGVISIVGQDMATFHKPYNALIRNQITPLLINNAVTGNNVSVVVYNHQLQKALNVIHGEIFSISKRVNLVIFGRGTVGGTLVKQIFDAQESILSRKNISLRIVAVANSSKCLFNPKGITSDEYQNFETLGKQYQLEDIFNFVKKHHLENLIAVDATASKTFVENYIPLIENGFDLVSANKIANTVSYDFYQKLRQVLKDNQKQYLYETNVGAGLPLIDTIKLLHLSGENITRIKGIFSGTLSYLFNTFSDSNQPFSQVLQTAIDSGYTEPDPREDLCGNDVGRKLLILARELDLENEFDEITIQNLIPEHLRQGSVADFLSRLNEFDDEFQNVKQNQEPNHVLRYVGDLHGNLSQTQTSRLEVKLVSVPKESALGQVKGADSIFEIYTESYGNHPIVIQGAGAGAAVTARGIFGDILRLVERGTL
ncbi:bifunctional aspartate kinase/homoserine dehydrogenase I [Capnocytophaga canimorsus]|uniref:bifunctional aspartate kinase/homoserine dehydrogenase I n=1 Tax=Capnocytophaga canimorsus TaxID=28188 RepID=UPI000D6E7ADD|nr:bifunctional aspartate kinase/homoserine dehydrogenase I [Capnocytophaga canimorsus]AWL78506.1 bifunctional aspartate kinase/homoserine dehydrogenase I [Capnocytophaga canimorsus]AYW37117.1 bifunctional aspartate kinase/homoserine dehydrogenase I [Capnocytophaga canimorsus]MDT9499859.1 bifunctional aspartate kinase/homoserine dehydrogenase I [Capnocytophaga canimorsus]